MKRSWKSNLIFVLEWLTMVGPTFGYSMYIYNETLVHTMSPESKGIFWSCTSLGILAVVIYIGAYKKYKRYVDSYVQQKTDLETQVNNELLIEQVTKKSSIIENLDFVMGIIPLLILISVLKAFANSIDQLILILEILGCSLGGKIALHDVKLAVMSRDMKKAIIPKE